MPKILHSRTGIFEKKGNTQQRMERGSRKRSSSAGGEKMEIGGGRLETNLKDVVRQAKTRSGL